MRLAASLLRRLSTSHGAAHHALPRFVIPAHLTRIKYFPLPGAADTTTFPHSTPLHPLEVDDSSSSSSTNNYAACEVQVSLDQLDLPRDTLDYILRTENKKHVVKRDLVVESLLPKPQRDNKRFCLDKLQHILDHALAETNKQHANKRNAPPPQHQKDKWKDEKQRHKEIKQSRAQVQLDKERFRPQHSRFGPGNESNNKF